MGIFDWLFGKKSKDSEVNDISIKKGEVKKKTKRKNRSNTKKLNVSSLYNKGDIIAIAIVYEGHLPEGYALDERNLASEIIDRAHQAGQLSGVMLSAHAGIRANRANESAWYSGSYEPVDDLPSMLNECLKDCHERMIANGEIPGPMELKTIQTKGWSSVASTVWVGMHIKQ